MMPHVRFRREHQLRLRRWFSREELRMKSMPTSEKRKLAARDMALGVAIVVTGLVMCGVSVMQLAHGQQLTVRQTEFAQTTAPQTDTPSVPAGNINGPAEAKPGGTRPTTPPPEPARPDEQQQKMGQKPALPSAPAEKMGEPVQK
jgi:hypothetical protein